MGGKRLKPRSKSFSLSELPSNYKFNGIDVMKFICAYLVCIIHIKPFTTDFLGIGNYLNIGLQYFLCRIAVPFYFVTSGFLLFRKMDLENLNTDKIKDYCFKLFRFFGIWTFLLTVGGRNQLWYLGALVFSVVLLSVLIKKKVKMKYLIILSVFLFAIGLLGDSYWGLCQPLMDYILPKAIIKGYESIFFTTRNGLFFGLIFVLMGVIFAHKRIVMNNKIAFCGFAVSMAFMLAEVFLLKRFSKPHDYNMYVFLVPAIFFLFYFVSHLKLKDRKIYGSLRTIGMLIFYLHLMVKYFVLRFLDFLKDKMDVDLTMFLLPLVLILVTVLAIFIERMAQRPKFKWLRYLYS